MSVYLVYCRECASCVSALGSQGGLRAAAAEVRDHKSLRGHEPSIYLATEVDVRTAERGPDAPAQQAGFGWRGPAHR